MEKYFIGVDLGTSGVKVILLSQQGQIISDTQSYPLIMEKSGWSEQNPIDWFMQLALQ